MNTRDACSKMGYASQSWGLPRQKKAMDMEDSPLAQVSMREPVQTRQLRTPQVLGHIPIRLRKPFHLLNPQFPRFVLQLCAPTASRSGVALAHSPDGDVELAGSSP